MEEYINTLDANLEYKGYELRNNIYYVYCESKTKEFKHPTKELYTKRVKTRYKREIDDISFNGKQVRIVLTVKVFKFNDLTNEKNQFAENFDFISDTYKINKRTKRLEQFILDLANNGSSSKTEKTLKRNGVKISDTSINRLIKKKQENQIVKKEKIKTIAIDDFAFKKGKTYGTVIIDHDTHNYIEFIDSRTKEDVEKVLKEYKNVEIVTRDRASSYGYAIKKALPKANQIADYFHLCMNLTDKGSELIKSKISKEIYFDDNFKVINSKNDAKYTLKRSKIEDIMYHGYKNIKIEEKKLVRIILKHHNDIKILFEQLKKFKNIIENKNVKGFKKLMIKWKNNTIRTLSTFTKGIYNDFDAVINTVKYDFTNGLAEGKINKIKTIKRALYGRCNSDLLYARLFLSDYFQSCE